MSIQYLLSQKESNDDLLSAGSNFRRETIPQLRTDFCPIGDMFEKIIGGMKTGPPVVDILLPVNLDELRKHQGLLFSHYASY